MSTQVNLHDYLHTTSESDGPFRLTPSFTNHYMTQKPTFGYNGLGELTYKRTYSRTKPDGTNEQFAETVKRVVEGTYTMQKNHIKAHGLGWNDRQGQASSHEMYARIYAMKFLPAGRGLWAQGSPITEERGFFAALNNCAAVSTYCPEDPSRPYYRTMDMTMAGIGVGFDCTAAGKTMVYGPDTSLEVKHIQIPDSRQGWVESFRELLDSYFVAGRAPVTFDFSLVRLKGAPIKTFGGKAGGPGPLKELYACCRALLDTYRGRTMTSRAIVDLLNLIGRAVISGNVRRTAEMAIGDANDVEFLNLKNTKINPERAEWGWTSNNSIFAQIGQDYAPIAKLILESGGEPGTIWLDNIHKYGRMNGIVDRKDFRVIGLNPCGEIPLESGELCNLSDVMLPRCVDKADFLRTLKFAYLYNKSVSLGNTEWPETNRVLLRNRRIGCGVSGVAQFLAYNSLETLRDWLESGYAEIERWDQVYSDYLCIPRSIRTTTVKPSGTLSLLTGQTPGIHFPHSRFYLRRVRLAADSFYIRPLVNAGYHVEADVVDSHSVVVSVPVDVGPGVRTQSDVSIWEKVHITAFLQRYWSNNSVSSTITFDPDTEASQLVPVLNYAQYHLKNGSFLPLGKTVYKQMPYETITEMEYRDYFARLKPVNYDDVAPEAAVPERYCSGESCLIEK